MSLFPANVFNTNPPQQQSTLLNNVASTFGTTLPQTTFAQAQPSTLALPQNADSAFGRRGGRGVARGFGRGGRGGRGGGFRGGRGGRGGFASLLDSAPQMFGGVQSVSSIFQSAGGSQHVPNPNQPLITQNLTQPGNFGRFQSREEPTLLGLDTATRNTGQRSLFDRPNTSTLSTATMTTNSTGNGNGGGMFNNAPRLNASNLPQNIPSLTGNGGLFNNRPARHYASVFDRPSFTDNRITQVPIQNQIQNSTTQRDFTFTASRQTIQNLNRGLAQPTPISQTYEPGQGLFGSRRNVTAGQLNLPLGNSLTSQPSADLSLLRDSVRALNDRLNPPLINSSNTASSPQPSVLNTNLAGTQKSAFSTNQPQIQATTLPVQQTFPENPQPQNESASEEEEEEYEEEEIPEGATTFAEDLQNLMANHQVAAPENIFSNDTFTQNLVQFLKGFHIKAPRNKVLFRPQEEEKEKSELESEDEIDKQEESAEKEEEPVQSRGGFNEVKEKEVREKLPSTRGDRFTREKNKKKERHI